MVVYLYRGPVVSVHGIGIGNMMGFMLYGKKEKAGKKDKGLGKRKREVRNLIFHGILA